MSTPSDRSSAAEGRLSPSFLATVYVNAFVVGAVVMGFEMLGSRYLNPLFGSGIYTWAALISTVLASLTAGYFFGGWMADRKPTPAGLGWLIVAGSIYLALIPLFSEALLEMLSAMLAGIQDQRDFERWGSILGAMLLLFVPLALLGVYSPYAIRLTLRATAQSGTVAGRIYGISTLGSIFGTLFVTFYLIPVMGSRNITYLLAAIGLASGLSFVFMRPAALVRALPAAAAALLLGAFAPPERALAEAPRAEPAQAAANEAADRFLAYLRKNGVEASHGAIEAGPGATGFRIVDLKLVGKDKAEWRAASLEAASFAERERGEAGLTGLVIVGIDAALPDKSSVKVGRVAAESLAWTAPPGEPGSAMRGIAIRDLTVNAPSGESVRIASIDLADARLASTGGALAGFALRTLTVTGGGENGSLGAFDIESVEVAMPTRVAIKGVAFRDFVGNLSRQGTVRIGAVELRAFEMLNVLDRNPADLRNLEFAIRGLEAPLAGGSDPKFERDMRALGYTQLKMNTELVYRYEEASKTYNLAKLEIDIADAAAIAFGLKIGGVTPDEIKQAIEPPPAPPPQPGQPPRPPPRQDAAAIAVAARLNLISADLSFKDKSLLGRILKQQADTEKTDEGVIRARYKAMLIGLRDEQTDPLAKEAFDALMAFLEKPGELVVEVRPPTPLSLIAVGSLAAANPAQLRSILGIKITYRP